MNRAYGLAVVLLGATASIPGRHTGTRGVSAAPATPAPLDSPPARGQGAAPVRTIVIEGVQVLLDSTQTLEGIQEALGKSTLVGPRHHDDFWSLCYTVPVANGVGELRLLSNELGGQEHTILGFELKEARGHAPSKATACPAIARRGKGTIAGNGLQLGMPVTDLLVRMGAPVKKSKGVYEFESSQSVKGRGAAQGYDISGSLQVETSRNRVTRLLAWYVKTT